MCIDFVHSGLIIDNYNRHLEDLIPVINYHPPLAHSNKRDGEKEKQGFSDEFRSDDRSIHAIQNITRAGRIDYQVS